MSSLNLLDDPDEWGVFSRVAAEGPNCWESNVVIEGMHCAACSLTVEEALRKVPGVLSAQVGAASHRARVVWSSDAVKPSAWMRAVAASGYRAVPANDVLAVERRRRSTRKALWQWLVAGLCMMQVMMYAFPPYVAEPGEIGAEMERLLRWASWVLSLPVVLFSCGPFFSNAWRDIRQRQVSMDLPVALGMLITFVVSSLGTFEPEGVFGQEVYFDSLTMFVFFLLTGRWLELRLRDRTAGALEALLNRLPDAVERRLASGQFERVAVRRLRVGDVLRVAPGQAFVADGRIVEGQTRVDEALLTGESRPLARSVGEMVLSGSHNLAGTVLVEVTRLGADTRFSQIVGLMESAAASKPQGVLLADRLAKPFLIAVIAIAALAGAWWWPQDPGKALMVAVAVLVVTCPCALSLATPAALLASAGALARAGVLVRRLQALEDLAHIQALVFDKTGTLTRDSAALRSTTVRSDGAVDQREALRLAASLARHSLHPNARALVQAAVPVDAGLSQWVCDGVQETSGLGVEGLVRDASLAPALAGVGGNRPRTLRLGSAAYCGADAARVATRSIHLADEQGWLASFELSEDLRPDARASIEALQDLGVEVHMLSGDAPVAAQRVAEQLQLRRPLQSVRGGCSPDDKLQAVRQLQQQGRRIAMVGDGLNDGPVLAGAEVSFAFGSAVPLAQAKADFVVLGAQLSAVVDTVRQARRSLTVVRQNLWWALGYNAASIPLAVAGWLPAWLAGLGMAASSLLVVINALRLARLTSKH